MILVDTSAWIDYFKGIENKTTEILNSYIESKDNLFINSFIYQELLQGAANSNEFKRLEEYLCTQLFCYLQDDKRSYFEAAKIFFDCRRKGVTVRSTVDCLIVQCAIENKFFLMHSDNDFDRIAKIIDKLKIYKIQ